jgi:hypothetical protein
MYFATGQKKTISKVENMGEIITLDDRSKWKVGILHKFTSFGWSMMDEVIVSSYLGNKYKIKNTKRNQEIDAEFIEK